MTSSKISLIFALFAFASVALAANPQCLRLVDGYIFDLCALETPVKVSLTADYYNATFTFAIAKPNVPQCDKNAAPGWFVAVHSRHGCYETEAPTFKLFQKGNRVNGLTIDYALENGNSYALRIVCDPIAPRDAKIKFELEGIEFDRTQVFAASSRHGCPVGKNFFEI